MSPLFNNLIFLFLLAFPVQSQYLKDISTGSNGLIKQESYITIDTIHHVGELFGGGVIFHVDRTGEHGLICNMSNIDSPSSYQLFKKQDPRPLGGRPDSAILVNQILAVNDLGQVKKLCENYTNSNFNTGVFFDWYLPSRDELEMLFRAKDDVNKTLKDFNQTTVDPLDKTYWSSSKFYDEIHNGDNILIDFEAVSLVLVMTSRPLPGIYFVRAIRSF